MSYIYIYICLWKKASVPFIEYTKIIWNRNDASGLCVPILFKELIWYLGAIGNINNDECLKYLFTGEFFNGNPNIFNNSQYHYGYK